MGVEVRLQISFLHALPLHYMKVSGYLPTSGAFPAREELLIPIEAKIKIL
jgi:hypothetical protein